MKLKDLKKVKINEIEPNNKLYVIQVDVGGTLSEAGYRKQNDTVKEILKPLYNVIMEHSDCCVNLSEDIKFLMEKYGIEFGDEE